MKLAPVLKLVISTLVIALLCSCFPAQYPPEWAPMQIPENDCPDISGVYSNNSQFRTGPYAPLPETLSIIFDLPKEQITDSITHIEIEQAAEQKIKVIAWNKNTLMTQKEFSEKDIYCSGDMLVIPGPAKSFSGGGQLGISKNKYSFTKSYDGALILKHKETAAGFYCILPLAGSGYNWHRFLPQEKSNLTLIRPPAVKDKKIPDTQK